MVPGGRHNANPSNTVRERKSYGGITFTITVAFTEPITFAIPHSPSADAHTDQRIPFA